MLRFGNPNRTKLLNRRLQEQDSCEVVAVPVEEPAPATVVLADLVARFNEAHPRPRERLTGAKGRAADRLLTNAYFKAWRDAVGSTGLNA